MHYSICDFVLDLIHNSIEADSPFTLVDFNETEDFLEVYIADQGCGMDSEQLEQALDPFYTDGKKHPNRKVGLGLPFLIQAVEQTEGEFKIDSKPGLGTSIYFKFNLNHVDTPPIGDVVATFRQALTVFKKYEMVINRSKIIGKADNSYSLVRSELEDALGDVTMVSNLSLLTSYIASQEEVE